MIKSEAKVGQLVIISKQCKYHSDSTNPRNLVGKITNIKEDGLPVFVQWSNEVNNAYDYKDLDLAPDTIQYILSFESGLKIGDNVKVLYSVPTRIQGWTESWVADMNDFIGRVGEILDISAASGCKIKLHGRSDTYWFPFMVLEKAAPTQCEFKLTKDYTAMVNFENKYIQVGCQTISFETINSLHKLINTHS